jgi:hypothetical protein
MYISKGNLLVSSVGRYFRTVDNFRLMPMCLKEERLDGKTTSTT